MPLMNKKNKASLARKNAEALKAKKKVERDTKGAGSSPVSASGKKGKSIVGQSKKKK